MAPARLCAPASPAPPGPDPAAQLPAAAAAWAGLSPVVAGGGAAARVRVSRDGGRSYPRSRERAWTSVVPAQPAAVRVYADDGTARCLTADLDASRGGRAQVDRDVAVLLALVGRCGGRAFTDSSPSGGRHVYVPLVVPVSHDELRPAMYALAALLPSLDVAPCVNLLAGCIRPPGARHKTGGWQRLDGPLEQALAIAQAPNGPEVWAALLGELRPQLHALQPHRNDPSLSMPPEAAGAAGPKQARAHAAGAVRPGGPRVLRPAVLRLAATGSYDTSRYGSPSQARQSVLASAAASGWTYGDVLEQLEAGALPGLWALYSRYRPQHRREALAGDWLNALAYARTPSPTTRDSSPPSAADTALRHPLAGRQLSAAAPPPTAGQVPAGAAGREPDGHVHTPDTREPTTQRGASPPSRTVTRQPSRPTLQGQLPADGYAFLRAWWTGVRLAERDRYAGRAGLSVRLVLRALGNAGQKTGRRHLAFGVRSLAIAAGLSRSTVAAVLRQLRDEADPLLSHLVTGRGLAGDLYELRIPDRYTEQARTRAWRPGRIEALLPCFRVLGVPAAFVYENLDRQPQSSWDLAATSVLSVRATQQALVELAAHHLAVRTRTGWARGPADPTRVARTLGADTLIADQVARYRTERDAWRTRLGAHPGPSIHELLHTRPAPQDHGTDSPVDTWLLTQQHPPPTGPPGSSRLQVDDVGKGTSGSDATAALALVVRLLGGTVLCTVDA